jgi:hypothetical protein
VREAPERDRVVGRLSASRAEIVARLLKHPGGGIVCTDCQPEGSELTERDIVHVLASDLPEIGPLAYRVDIVRCDQCGRVWTPFTRNWIERPKPLEM